MRKDLGLTLEEGRSLAVSLPVTALIDQFYAEVQAMGGGRQDTSALVRRLLLTPSGVAECRAVGLRARERALAYREEHAADELLRIAREAAE